MAGYPWLQDWLKVIKATQAQLAQAMGLDEPKTARIISGDREFKPKELFGAAEFFGCTIEEIISGERKERLPQEKEALLGPRKISDSEIAILGVIYSLVTMLTADNPPLKTALIEMFREQKEGYRRLDRPLAEEIPHILLDVLSDKKQSLHPHMLLQMLAHAPFGSA